jgi:hypothetical protein
MADRTRGLSLAPGHPERPPITGLEMTMKRSHLTLALCLGSACLFAAGPARAQNVTLGGAGRTVSLTTRPASFGQRGRVDARQLMTDLGALSHDSMQGRRVNTPGSEKARRFLIRSFDGIGALPVAGQRLDSFDLRDNAGKGVNVMGMYRGTANPDDYIVVSAHYDHLGIRTPQTPGADSIFNGADDDASGTVALLAFGRWLKAHPPKNSVILVAFDAEEGGLQGSRAWVATPPVPKARIVMDISLDMVSRNEKRELYASGTYHYPMLGPLVDSVKAASKLTLIKGHDSPNLPRGDDWTQSSDHGPFHTAGIPFMYFGVEDHPDYHRASDSVEKIEPGFYAEVVETVLDFFLWMDSLPKAGR